MENTYNVVMDVSYETSTAPTTTVEVEVEAESAGDACREARIAVQRGCHSFSWVKRVVSCKRIGSRPSSGTEELESASDLMQKHGIDIPDALREEMGKLRVKEQLEKEEEQKLARISAARQQRNQEEAAQAMLTVTLGGCAALLLVAGVKAILDN